MKRQRERDKAWIEAKADVGGSKEREADVARDAAVVAEAGRGAARGRARVRGTARVTARDGGESAMKGHGERRRQSETLSEKW
eukprot:SAG11_NODE_13618_length_647_cov_0.819343_2_plen_83_part_00